MAKLSTIRRPSSEIPDSSDTHQSESAAPWLTIVADKVKNLRFGVVQVIVHDSKVVQIERTERTRFDVPSTSNGR